MPDFMEGDDFMKFRFSRYLVSSMDASSGMTNWEMTDANFLNFWGNGSQIVKNMYLNKNYTDWVDIVTRNGSQQNHSSIFPEIQKYNLPRRTRVSK